MNIYPIFVKYELSNDMKRLLGVLACIIILIMNAQAQENPSTSDIKRLTGCWNDSQSKEWRYGFFEIFAIYDNEFWEYQSIDFS